MKKILATLVSIFIIVLTPLNMFAQTTNSFLSKNTLIPVYPTKTLSTSVYEEGDTFYFIVTSDIWMDEYKIVPKNSIIKTKITMLKMPIKGINAAMKIYAEEIAFPTGERYPIKGFVTYKGEEQIGGDLTAPASYNKSLHPMKGEYFNGVIAQYVPSGEYEFGQHVTLMTNEILHLVLDEDFSP